MRRADRLFQIVQNLHHERVITAHELAEELEVSERTIYRDIQDLSLSGVPITGEAGQGYRLLRGFHLPPLMFNAEGPTKAWRAPPTLRCKRSKALYLTSSSWNSINRKLSFRISPWKAWRVSSYWLSARR